MHIISMYRYVDEHSQNPMSMITTNVVTDSACFGARKAVKKIHIKDTYKVQKIKTLKMTQRMQNMLHESWHQCDSVTPFLKTLLTCPN